MVGDLLPKKITQLQEENNTFVRGRVPILLGYVCVVS